MVTPLTFVGDADALLRAIPEGHPGALAAFYDRYAPHVLRTLESTLGADNEIPDILQEVFIRAIDGIRTLRDPARLEAWLSSIAVFTARAQIRRRARRKWLSLRTPPAVVEQEPACLDARNALREVYRLLASMPVDERLAFTLRYIEGMPPPDAAEAMGVSLATFKRRLSRAAQRFCDGANSRPALLVWFTEGTRWTLQKNL